LLGTEAISLVVETTEKGASVLPIFLGLFVVGFVILFLAHQR
jgi:hypothetical protein